MCGDFGGGEPARKAESVSRSGEDGPTGILVPFSGSGRNRVGVDRAGFRWTGSRFIEDRFRGVWLGEGWKSGLVGGSVAGGTTRKSTGSLASVL